MLKDISGEFPSPIEHACLLHKDMDNKLICEIFILLDDLTSFSVLVSNNASLYLKKKHEIITIILKSGEIINF